MATRLSASGNGRSGSLGRYPLTYPELALWRDGRAGSALAAISTRIRQGRRIARANRAGNWRPCPPTFSRAAWRVAAAGRWFTASDEGNVTEWPPWPANASGSASAAAIRRLSADGGVARWRRRDRHRRDCAAGNSDYPDGAGSLGTHRRLFRADLASRVRLHSRRIANFHFLGRLAPGSPSSRRAQLDLSIAA